MNPELEKYFADPHAFVAAARRERSLVVCALLARVFSSWRGACARQEAPAPQAERMLTAAR